MSDILKDLNLVVYSTFKVFDDFKISTKHILASEKFCVIDLDKKYIKETFKTKKEAYEYVSYLTNQLFLQRRLENKELN